MKYGKCIVWEYRIQSNDRPLLEELAPILAQKAGLTWTSNSCIAPLSRASVPTPQRSGPAADAACKGYRKICPRCKRSYGMKDEECETCHVRLSVVNEYILSER